jgi:polyribonucleotide nucleotidyltransferase
MQPDPRFVERKIGGKLFRFETGRLAGQASGAVMGQVGETTILATATTSSPRGDGDFFPLTVDIEEKMYAAGKIPGGFFRREGRAGEKATLLARLIDRPLRPAFPDGFRHEVHIVVTTLSVDDSNPMDILSLNAASAALAISDAPFEGPIGAVRVSHIDGQWVPHPTHEEEEEATIELVIAGRMNPTSGEVDIMMIEAGGSEHMFDLIEAGATAPNEEILADGIEAAKPYIAEIIDLQNELVNVAGKPKGSIDGDKPDFPLFVDYTDEIMERVRAEGEAALSEALAIQVKADRRKRLADVTEDLISKLADESDDVAEKMVANAVRSLAKKIQRKRIIEENVRLDGRRTDEVRPIWAQTSVIPRVHGSGLFTRGETQALTITTLGMGRMEQMVDDLSLQETKRYMHNYNFPPYSTGEAGFMRGPKRREIGHGALAEKAILPVIPAREDFPYAIRVVSEIMSSNGSTSMASVCGSSLSLMDAGVPVRGGKHVGGVAMGLVNEGDTFVPLTDILGDEDAAGDMDFKVAGTEDVVTALQLDTKIQGIPAEVLRKALMQARDARLHIISKMNESLAAPRDELQPRAPRIEAIKVPTDKIGEVIGPKGKHINQIVEESGAEIDIQQDGTIFIGAADQAAADRAIEMIEELANPKLPEPGERYQGTVVKAMPFGAFVNILPGRDGLVHISKLGEGRIDKVEDAVNVGDTLEVEITEVDSVGKVNLTPVAWLDRQVAQGKSLEEARAAAGESGGSRRSGGRDRDRGRGPRRDGGGGRDRDRGRRNDGDGPRRERAPRRDEA